MAVILDPRFQGNIEFALACLVRGDPVGVPTETVYGLAALATEPRALAKIFKLKDRPYFDPLIVHGLSLESFSPLVEECSDLQRRLAKKFWPGPLTMLFKKSSLVPDLCTASLPEVALRVPADPVMRALLARLGEKTHAPWLAAPSANRFGRISPTCSRDVVEELGPYGLEAVVEGGPCRFGIESTIIRVVGNTEIEILREGALSSEELRAELGEKIQIRSASPQSVEKSSSHVAEALAAAETPKALMPGQLLSHYAPRTPAKILDANEFHSLLLNDSSARYAFLSVFSLNNSSIKFQNPAAFSILSTKNSDLEAAARLYSELRRLDALKCKGIYILLGPEEGLGRAINDRLRRASSKAS